MGKGAIYLAELVEAANPALVLKEVEEIFLGRYRNFDFEPVRRAYATVRSLFAGDLPGYQRCNTRYHDLEHTTDTLLAMARLIDGAAELQQTLDVRTAQLGLISALLHDTGYIQRDDDRAGTGAKYTATHIKRSIDFTRAYFASQSCFTAADYELCRKTLLCTGLDVRIADIPFASEEERLVGMMLGTADLLGQMASRTYLEKLPHLYEELEEGQVRRPGSEFDFLKDTAPFYRTVLERFAGDLGGAVGFMRAHFRARWKIDRNLYLAAIEENVLSLESILRNHPEKYRSFLKLEAEEDGFRFALSPTGQEKQPSPLLRPTAVL